ncbi:MAG: choice-of-anchor B family protein [Sphingobacteriales bacterium]|nr:choice-of-anchor B family protein [Sphingobacteriales bacterium]
MQNFSLSLLLFIISTFSVSAQSQLNTTLLGHLDYTDQLSNVWGYAANQHEYAIVGTYNGTSIVDVTNPATPTELFFIDGQNGIWREPKVWNNYAYVSNETGGGLRIINLANLPNSIDTTYWTGGTLPNGTTYTNNTTHDLFVDYETGYLYLTGSNQYNGLVVLDLNANPTNPPIVGLYTGAYVHDGYARNDTVYVGQIYAGNFAVINMADKANPIVLATKQTPNNFTHNCHVSDDGNYIYTTDEKSGAYVAAYDISDLSDIKETDRFRRSEGTGVIPHNTYVVNTNYVVTSYYRDGVSIVDATYPNNLIETGHYDTSPLAGNGFNGAWGVYAYLPSGNLLVSDMEEGLFIIHPTYTKAAYLIGNVTDAATGQAISGVQVNILTTTQNATSTATGSYATGTALAGTYQVQFIKAGYVTQTQTVSLTNNQTTTLNVALSSAPPFNVNIQLLDANTSLPIPNATVALNSALYTNTATTNAAGIATFSLTYVGDYNIYAGRWGYITDLVGSQALSSTNNALTIPLQKGYYDDFLLDFGWTVTGNAAQGMFDRGTPTQATLTGDITNPGNDAPGDFGNFCYLTGTTGGLNNNVNNGYTQIASPIFDLTSYAHPKLSFYRWSYLQSGSLDTMIITLSNGITSVTLEQIFDNNIYESNWALREFLVEFYITPTANMRLTVRIGDYLTNNVVEGGFDLFRIQEAQLPPTANFTANSNSGCAPFTTNLHSTSLNDVDTYQWILPGSDIGSSNQPSPNPIYSTAGTYDVTLVVTNSVGTDSLTIPNYITVLETPSINPTPSSPTICSGSTVTLNSNAIGTGLSYQWFGADMQQNNLASITAQPSVFSAYTVIVTSQSGCTAQASLSINVNPSPQVEVSTNNTQICAGGSFTLNATSTDTPAPIYTWTGNGIPTTNGNTLTANITNAGTYNLQLSATNTNGCTCIKDIVVNATPPPTVQLSLAPSICADSTATISATATGNAPFTYTWTGNYLSQTNQAETSLTPTLPNGVTQATEDYTLLVTDANGCTTLSTIETSIMLCSAIGFDSANEQQFMVSPNPNSGAFMVLMPPTSKQQTLIIYNSLGQEVFRTQTNVATNTSAIPYSLQLPNGIYQVVLQSNNKQYVHKMVVDR